MAQHKGRAKYGFHMAVGTQPYYRPGELPYYRHYLLGVDTGIGSTADV